MVDTAGIMRKAKLKLYIMGAVPLHPRYTISASLFSLGGGQKMIYGGRQSRKDEQSEAEMVNGCKGKLE